MALDKLVDSTKLDACLDAEADAIRAKTGGSSPIPYDYANNKGFADAIAAIPSGTTITDGIVYTSVDANGFPLTADYYVSSGIIPANFFFPGYAPSSWDPYTSSWHKNLQTLTIKGKVNTLSSNSFKWLNSDIIGDFSEVTTMPGDKNTNGPGVSVFLNSGVRELSFDSLIYFTGQNFVNCSRLTRVYAPKCQSIYSKWDAGASRATFGNCTALQNVQLGSVGFPCSLANNQIFLGCAQSGLTIILFTTGANVDTQVSKIRNGATNATIIIKASEATTYNGTSYAAGDTILTSEVEQTS